MGPLAPLYIGGAGGMGREALTLLRAADREREVSGFVVDDAFAGAAGAVEGLPVRPWSAIAATASTLRFVVAIGSTERGRLITAIERSGGRFETLVHPSVEIPPGVEIGVDCIVLAGAIFTTNIRVGPHTIINLGCTLSHDVRVGRQVTLAPGVHLAGRVQVEDEATIGIGAVVIDGVTIGAGTVIGAGAVVTKDIPPGVVAVGVPARVIRHLA